MPPKVPERENGEGRSDVSPTSESDRDDKSAVSDIFKRLKARKKKRQPSTDDKPASWDIDDLAAEMRRLGLEPTGLGKFIRSLHRLAVASNVDAVALASLIKELSILSEGRHLSMEQVRKNIQRLSDEQAQLTKKVAELNDKKTSTEIELNQLTQKKDEKKQSLSHLAQLNDQLEQFGITTDDLSRLAVLIASAAQLGHSPSEISNVLTKLTVIREETSTAEAELEKILEAKRATQQKVIALDNEVTEKQNLLDSAANIARLGFEPKDLEDISAAVRMIAKTRNIDESAAKQRLIADLQSYYANDQDLRTRLRTMEALLREKEEKFGMLDTELRNERAVLENASKLISAGVNEQWLTRLRSIIDSYGLDLESLARELQIRKGLNANIEELAKTKKALEEEERLLRQKVVAVEDQRIKTLSLINDLIVHASRPRAEQDLQQKIMPTVSLQQGTNKEFLASAKQAIEIIRAKLPPDSPARLVLDHALLALRLESDRE